MTPKSIKWVSSKSLKECIQLCGFPITHHDYSEHLLTLGDLFWGGLDNLRGFRLGFRGDNGGFGLGIEYGCFCFWGLGEEMECGWRRRRRRRREREFVGREGEKVEIGVVRERWVLLWRDSAMTYKRWA